MKFPMLVLMFLILCPSGICAQKSPLLGDWQEPEGSIIRVEPCSTGICLRIVQLAPNAPSRTDMHNPQPAFRTHQLCGLEIGHGFSFTDNTHASGGYLYDPKSGNTYHGDMTVKGDQLSLRGYIGLSIFGRTEIWRRPHADIQPCFTTH